MLQVVQSQLTLQPAVSKIEFSPICNLALTGYMNRSVKQNYDPPPFASILTEIHQQSRLFSILSSLFCFFFLCLLMCQARFRILCKATTILLYTDCLICVRCVKITSSENCFSWDLTQILKKSTESKPKRRNEGHPAQLIPPSCHGTQATLAYIIGLS